MSVNRLEVVGGLTVARTEVAAGEVLLQEAALVTGPGRAGLPVCITCYARVDGEYYCNGCSWQCCGEDCELREEHREECQVFREKDIYAAWDCVDQPTLTMDFMGPHRLLLAIKKNPELREILGINVENDLRKKRFNIKYYVDCEDVITKYIRDQCGLTGFTEDEILTALGLFELYGQPLQNGAKAVFPGLLRMRHSCRPNCYFSLGPDNSITVRASQDLVAGQEVTRSYVDVMKCNLFRRRDLEKEFFVDCDCERCRDGGEMDTNYGGLVSPQYNNLVFVPADPRDEASPWINKTAAGVELSGPECCQELDLLRRKCEAGIAETQGNPATIEFILNNPGEWDVLPRQGQVMMDVKKCLVEAYGNMQVATYDVLETEKIRTKVTICNELLQLYARFHPGYNYNAAMLHYEAAHAIYGLHVKGDHSLSVEGREHCEAVERICREEQSGSLYDQVKQFVVVLKEAMM